MALGDRNKTVARQCAASIAGFLAALQCFRFGSFCVSIACGATLIRDLPTLRGSQESRLIYREFCAEGVERQLSGALREGHEKNENEHETRLEIGGGLKLSGQFAQRTVGSIC
jgi:hypothetical protein